MAQELCFALRGAFGSKLYKNLENPELIFDHPLTPPDDIRVMKFSHDGQYYAICDSIKTKLIEVDTGKVVLEHNLPKPTSFVFSPKDNIFVSWEPYVVYGLRRNKDGELRVPNPNLHFFSVKEMKHLLTIIAKKKEEIPQWTEDEKYMVRISGSELFVSDGTDIEDKKFKTVISDVKSIQVSPNVNDYSVAVFVPSIKGMPARVEIRKITNDFPTATTQTLMNCDKVNMLWNSRGSHLLILSTVEVDTSGQSYYGRSYLNVVSCNGDKIRVDLDKNGPIHDIKWIPGTNNFAVCYGFMPSKVSIFNFNGNKIWDLGEGPRNEIHFNPQGTLMITCGFGSLAAGKIQIWDIEKEKEINLIEVPNTTHLGFSPDGQYFFTAITAPRMRVDNSYRLWHFTGKQLYEFVPERFELWEVQFRELPPSKASIKFSIPELTKEEKLKTGVPIKLKDGKQVTSGAVKKAGAYIPPNKRKEGSNEGALKPVGTTNTVRTEEDKKMRRLKHQLTDIQKLKRKIEEGVTLEKNQLDKLERESEFQKEYDELVASMSISS